MPQFWQDARSGARALWKTPGATAVGLLSLTLGIGANTAIFSLVNALLVRTLPVPHPEQLVALHTTIADRFNGDESFTLPMFENLRSNKGLFAEVFSNDGGGISNFEADGQHHTAALAPVSGNYYRAMRLTPLLGRFIEPGDVALNSGTSNAVAVISFRVWRSWYHGDPEVIGKTIRIESHLFMIIGVEPEGYSGLIIDGSSDVTVPLFAPGSAATREPKFLSVTLYGRLLPGLTMRQAQAGLSALWPHVLEASRPPDYEGAKRSRFFARRIKMESAATGVSFLRKRFSNPLLVLLAIVGAVLLIACLNLANLALAKAAARSHETAVKTALGARAWDLMRLPVWESVLLSATGATMGLALAYWASTAILHVAWTGLVQIPISTSPDGRVLAFTAVVATASSLIFAALPAWYAARTDPMESLAHHTRSVRGGSGLVGKVLLVAQMSLSLVLIVGALLFGQTLARLHNIDVGYRRDHLLTLLLFPQPGTPKIQNFNTNYEALANKLKSLPGVESASYSGSAPASDFEDKEQVYQSQRSETIQAVEDSVAPGFFETLGMHVLRGREFTWADDEHTPPVVIISQTLANRLFGKEDPIGRSVFIGLKTYPEPYRIVGVVNSARLWKVESPHPLAIYRCAAQQTYFIEPMLDVRTSLDPHVLKAAVEKAVRSMGRFYSLRTMTANERLDSFLTVQRLTAWLASFFGATALLIACIGLYGLVSFHVTRRTSEMGIRTALGAQRGQILAMILREALSLAAMGCVIGLATSLAAGRLVKGMLFGISATDPFILAFAILALLLVALLAGLLPARRAAAVDPMTALRTG